jgi:DNA mismatch repair protein MutL
MDAQENDLLLSGLLGKPGQSRSTRKEMIFFVNRRPVDSRTLSYAVIEAFHTFVPKGRFPPAILFLEIDPAAVDVNVHPSKREIRFRDDPKVRSFILNSVLAHNRAMASPSSGFKPTLPVVEYEEENGRQVPKIDSQALELFGQSKIIGVSQPKSNSLQENPGAKEETKKDHQPDLSDGDNKKIPPSPSSAEIIPRTMVGNRRDPGAEWRFLDRPHGDLAVFSTPQGMVALHARAAYERVRFEQLEDSLRDHSSVASQSLLLPEPLEFDGIDRASLEVSLVRLRELGFVLEEFGRNFYRLEGCPHWIDPEYAVRYLHDFLEIARENGGALQVESFVRQALERQANYRDETKDDFSDDEIMDLANRLLRCRNPYVCPKGRPIYFEIPTRDFEHRFKRKL